MHVCGERRRIDAYKPSHKLLLGTTCCWTLSGCRGGLVSAAWRPSTRGVGGSRGMALPLMGRLERRSVFLSSLRSLRKTGAPEEIRTPDPQIRSLVLYPAELRARLKGANLLGRPAKGKNNPHPLRQRRDSPHILPQIRSSIGGYGWISPQAALCSLVGFGPAG